MNGLIYARPVINGVIVQDNIDFIYDGNKAVAQYILADEKAKDFITELQSPVNLGVTFDSDKDPTGRTLLPHCSVEVSKIDSKLDNYTFIELTFEAIVDSQQNKFRKID